MVNYFVRCCCCYYGHWYYFNAFRGKDPKGFKLKVKNHTGEAFGWNGWCKKNLIKTGLN